MSIKWSDSVDRSSQAEPTARSVLAYLARRADEHGACWPNIATIAAATGWDVSTVRRVLRHLEDLGELVIVPRGGGTGRHGNQYRIVLDDVDRAGARAQALREANTTRQRVRRLYRSERAVQTTDSGSVYRSERAVQEDADSDVDRSERALGTAQSERSVPLRVSGVITSRTVTGITRDEHGGHKREPVDFDAIRREVDAIRESDR